MKNSPRLMIAGTGSSSGKTTLSCGLIKAFKNMGKDVAAFKCGPDYIDPMFHEAALGVPSSNLDMFLCGKDGVLNILGEKGQGMISVIEGVMGFYDGLGGASADFSSHDLSRLTDTPVILVVSCKGKSLSLAAEIKGFLEFMPNNIKGVILNRASSHTEKMYRDIVEKNTSAKIYGFLPKIDEIHFQSRHLGLVTVSEIEDISKKLDILSENVAAHVDLDAISLLAESAEPLSYNKINIEKKGSCRIGVAKDEAFCFYYKENFEILEKMGAEIVYFSPLSHEKLPVNLHGLIFGGGYPELYLEKLSRNPSMIDDIKTSAYGGMPIWGECGGFMYLMENVAYNGASYPMCGVLKGESFMSGKLVRFGYSNLTALEDTLLLKKGEKINAHEFHYCDSSDNGAAFLSEKPAGSKGWKCVRSEGNIFGGYPHIHFYGNLKAAENFIDACLIYSKGMVK